MDIGHVEFANAEMATKCLALDGCDMMNRYIKVARPMTPRLFQEKQKLKPQNQWAVDQCMSRIFHMIPLKVLSCSLLRDTLLTHPR